MTETKRRTAAEIWAYCEAATEGPWEGCHTSADGMASMIHITADDCILAELVGWNKGLPQMKADATFCVLARTDMPRLLDRMERYRDAAAKLREALWESNVYTTTDGIAFQDDKAMELWVETAWLAESESGEGEG